MTSPTKAAKRRGAQWEIDLTDHIRNQQHLKDVERLVRAGKNDEGDITFVGTNGRWIIEAKNAERINLAGWIKEAFVEAYNYATKRKHSIAPLSVVIIKARRKAIQEAYVVMRLEQFLDLA